MMSLRGSKRRGNLFLKDGLLRYTRIDGQLSLRATKSRSNPFLILIILLILCFNPCQAAIEFDGVNDYIDLKSNIPLDSNNWTLSLWINSNDVTGPLNRILSYYGNGPTIWKWNNAGSVSLYIVHSGSIDFNMNTNLVNNIWSHIVVTRNGSTITAYQDGIQTAINSSFSINFTADTSVRIGNSTAYNEPFNGKLDDIRIYNRALSSTEVQTIFNSRSKRPNSTLTNGLIAHYEMDDDAIGEVAAQAKDSSGNLNHGQFIGFDNLTTALSNDVPAQIETGHSLEFDGVDDYFSVANHTSLKPIDKITIGYWFKRNPGEKNQLGAFQSSSVANSDYILQVYNDNYIYMSIPNGGSNQYFISTSTTVDTNWNFLYAVYDGTQTGNSNRLKVYLNSVLIPGAYGGTIPAILNQGTLPIENRYNLNYTQGLMDNARIYNRALSASEISFLYNGSGLDPGTSNLQALWTFDDDSAVKDSSGNTNHGVGVGGDSLKYTEGVLRR